MGLRPRTTPAPSSRQETLRSALYISLISLIFVQAGLYSARSNAHDALSALRAQRHAHDLAVLADDPLVSLPVNSTAEDGPGKKGWKDRIKKPLQSVFSSKNPPHPIAVLMADGEARYRRRVAGQSRTLKDAVKEYERRYGRSPPKGFDAWWAFAKSRDVVMKDEYDSLVGDLRPFWEMGGAEFRRRVEEAGRYPGIDIVRIRGGKAEAVNPRNDGLPTSGRSAGFMAMMHAFVSDLPDMDLALNALISPRVLLPYSTPNSTIAPLASVNSKPPHYSQTYLDSPTGGTLWDTYRHHCPPHTSARALYRSLRPSISSSSRGPLLSSSISPIPGPFVPSLAASSLDFCKTPSAHTLHSHFFSPRPPIPELLPILSSASAQGYSDIKVPSHYYYWPSRRHTYAFDAINLVVGERDASEEPWEHKSSTFFWRGPSSGGSDGGLPSGYAGRYQRQRMMGMSLSGAEDVNKTIGITYPDKSVEGGVGSVSVNARKLKQEAMDMKFTRFAGQDSFPGGLRALKEAFPFDTNGTVLGERWGSKYALDLDGEGYSGVFMALMESESAVVKSSVYSEWWNEWAEPWVQYVPLSVGYGELWDLRAYFSGVSRSGKAGRGEEEREGDRRLRRIARAGKQWRKTVARGVDMEVYVYRLVLEYARLWADDRQSMDFVMP